MKSHFGISNFLAATKIHGFARPYRFEVEIPRPQCVKATENEKVSLYCKAAQLPQTRIITSRNQYLGPPEFRPIGLDLGGDNLTLTFYVDAQMRVKAFFDEWMDGIVDRASGITRYRDDYIVRMKIRQLIPVGSVGEPALGTGQGAGRSVQENTNNFINRESVAYEVTFDQAFPVAVNPLTLDHGSVGQVHELSVTFNYRRWTWKVPDAQTGKLAANEFWNDPSIPEKKVAGNNVPDVRPYVNNPKGSWKNNA